MQPNIIIEDIKDSAGNIIGVRGQIRPLLSSRVDLIKMSGNAAYQKQLKKAVSVLYHLEDFS